MKTDVMGKSKDLLCVAVIMNRSPWGTLLFIPLLITAMLAGISGLASAATATTAGTISARDTSATTIRVTMPYTGDDTNPNNVASVQWKLCSQETYPPVWINAEHSASPYQIDVTYLTPGTCYTIKAMYLDSDSVIGKNVQTVNITAGWDSTLLHNSNRFPGSTKWQAQGGWGQGGQYGEINCETCHTKITTNIKRIKDTPLTAETGSFPAQTDLRAPNFQSVTAPNGFGDDSDNHTSSSKICEVCHSTTSYHRYNTTGQTVKIHYNNYDCIACHKHSGGFSPPECNTCHGYPPTDATLTSFEGKTTGSVTSGKHATHVTTLGFDCDNCHKNNVMPQLSSVPGLENRWDISISFSNFGITTGSYSGQAGSSYNNAAGTTAVCSNVYCHGSTLYQGRNPLPPPDQLPAPTPSWTTGTIVCGNCHKTDLTRSDINGALPGTVASHARHAGTGNRTQGMPCSDCHGTSGAGAAGHVSGTIEWALNTAKAGTDAKYKGAVSGFVNNPAPSSSYGQCTNVYCHSNAQPEGGVGVPDQYKTPTWGNNSTGTCGTCHNEIPGSNHGVAAYMASGSHTKHLSYRYVAEMGTALEDGFMCVICHSWQPAYSLPTRDCYTCHSYTSTKHANRQVEVAIVSNFNQGGLSSYSGTPAPGDGYGSCSTTYCHSTGQSLTDGSSATPTSYSSPDWGAPASAACGTCHPATKAAFNTTNSGSHMKHLNATSVSGCDACHTAVAADGSSYPDVIAGYYPKKTLHVNKLIDVASGLVYELSPGVSAAGTPGNGYGTCSTVSCHSNGSGSYKTTPVWGSVGTGCNMCHDAQPTSGAHARHVNTAASGYGSTSVSTTGGVNDFGCGNCHPVDIASHADGTVQITLNNTHAGTLKSKNNVADDTGGYTRTAGVSVTCAAAYCHTRGNGTFDRSSLDWFSTYTGDRCSHCHYNSPDTGSHATHIMPGIHYDNIYTGTSGLKPTSTRTVIINQPIEQRPHGNAATATTISCNNCHSGTVNTAYNRRNSQCITCHDLGQAVDTAKGDADMIIASGSTMHLDGSVQVSLPNAATVRSKAQLRNDGATATGAPLGWTRNINYKDMVQASNDSSLLNSTGLDWNSGSKTCTTACHLMQQSPVWGTTSTCTSCHTVLP